MPCKYCTNLEIIDTFEKNHRFEADSLETILDNGGYGDNYSIVCSQAVDEKTDHYYLANVSERREIHFCPMCGEEFKLVDHR